MALTAPRSRPSLVCAETNSGGGGLREGTTRGSVGPEATAREALDAPSTDLLGEQRRSESRERISQLATAAGIRRVDVVAWRDLDDAEAGGSELHADEILQRWADGGIDVRLWTSRVDGAARQIRRNGYTINRRAGRYAVFPRTAVAGFRRKIGNGDALVEIWNGMPFFSPVWSRTPRIVLLHHVHARDVGHGAFAHAGPPRPHDGAKDRSALLPEEPDRHPVRVGQTRSGQEAQAPRRPGHGRPPGRRRAVLPRSRHATRPRW